VLAPAHVPACAPRHGLPAPGAERLPPHEREEQPARGAGGDAPAALRAARSGGTSSSPSSTSHTS
jgi:hypothetical protein